MYKVSNQLLSRYRTPLLGVASLLILASHFYLFPDAKVITSLQSQSIVGVDIFLFLSGFGLVYSLKNNPSLGHFYKQRMKRILPIYFPIVLVYCVVSMLTKIKFGEGKILLILSTLGYWLKTKWFLEWYTLAIFMLYLLFPVMLVSVLLHHTIEYILKRFANNHTIIE